MNFWASLQTSDQHSKPGRTPPGLRAFRCYNPARNEYMKASPRFPGVGKVLKSPVVAKTLQSAYHRLNSRAQKYEQLAPEERRKWEEYYAADQEELSKLLGNLQVIE